MAIGFRASATADTGSSTNFNVAKPAGAAATDILVLVIAWSGVTTDTITAPGGWTAVATKVSVGNIVVSVYWALGNVASVAFSNSSARDNAMICAAFAGVDNTTPIDATGTTSTITGAASITANAVTVVTANAWEIICGCDWNDGVFSATGFTDINNGNPAAHQTADMLYNTTPKSTGSTGTVTVNDSASATSQQLVAIPFALRPDTSGPADPGGLPNFGAPQIYRPIFSEWLGRTLFSKRSTAPAGIAMPRVWRPSLAVPSGKRLICAGASNGLRSLRLGSRRTLGIADSFAGMGAR